jgi:hypothetical protein
VRARDRYAALVRSDLVDPARRNACQKKEIAGREPGDYERG